jgi:hypothetical protein
MCGSNPELAPEVNKAKCLSGAVLAFGIVTLLGFGIPPGGIVSALGGLLSLIGGSIVCCCGPKTKGTGNGQLMAGAVLSILALIFHFIGAVLCIAFIVIANAGVAAVSSGDGMTSICSDNCDSQWTSESECTTWGYSSCAEAISTCKDNCASASDDLANNSDYQDARGAAQAGVAVITLALGLPTLIFSLVAFSLEIALTVFCFRGRKANMEEGGPTVQGNKQ